MVLSFFDRFSLTHLLLFAAVIAILFVHHFMKQPIPSTLQSAFHQKTPQMNNVLGGLRERAATHRLPAPW